MDGKQLYDDCIEAQGRGQSSVVVTLPGRWGKRETIRLGPGLSGRIVADLPGKRIAVMIECADVIAAVERRRASST